MNGSSTGGGGEFRQQPYRERERAAGSSPVERGAAATR